jgi:pimeloyl-ACP methyl ester carboxylesterase
MTTILWVVPAVAVLSFAVNKGLLHLFRNQKQPHQHTPEQYGLSFDPVRFPTKKALSLYGWWIPAQDEAAPTLILVHGWGRNVERCLPYIQQLHKTGYNLLAFDSRNHGSSDGDGFSSMPKFSEDILAAVDFVTKEKGAEALGIIGLSIGGAASIYAVAHDDRIQCTVTIGAFAHPADVMLDDFKKRRFPLLFAGPLFRYVEYKIGVPLEKIAPLNNIGNIKTPILLIHGENDATIPLEHGRRLHKAALERANLWIVPGKGHSDCHLHPEFWTQLQAFLASGFR